MQKTTTILPPGRYVLAMGMFLLALLLYIDRVCISVAKDPISESLQLSDTAMGWVLSIFALGYALFQVPGGIIADKWGPRKMLTAIVSIWSVLTALTGAAWNFVSLMTIRFLFGAGEAGAFPGISRAIYAWIPLRERGIITGINFSGSRLGAAFALPFVAWLIGDFGWRMSFLILGFIGIIWAVIWWVFFRDDPKDHPMLSETEKQKIVANRQDIEINKAEINPVKFSQLMDKSSIWLIMGQYFCSNFTFFFALTWLFPHLKTTYHLEALEAGWYASAPLVFGAFGNWVSGLLVDFLYKRGNWNLSRRLPAAVGFALAAIGLIGSVYQTEALGAVIMLSIAIFGADMTLSPSWSLCIDIGKSQSGMISGTMNMAGNLGSFITALAFPYLQAWTGGTNWFFFLGAGLNVLAIYFWFRLRADHPIVF